MRDNEQPPADPRLLAALAKADLDDLGARLLGLARRKMWCRWKGLPPSGETPEDIVQKAFHQALSGVRKFPKENVGLYVFFVMVVRRAFENAGTDHAAVDELMGQRALDLSLEPRPERTSTPQSPRPRR